MIWTDEYYDYLASLYIGSGYPGSFLQFCTDHTNTVTHHMRTVNGVYINV